MNSKDPFKNLQNLLTPPGNGVFTVHTAQEKKEKLHQKLFASKDPQKVHESWEHSLQQLKGNKKALLLGIPSDCGGGILRGANWGPLFLRETFLTNSLNKYYHDLGDIRTIPHLLQDELLNEQTIKRCQRSLYGTDQTDFPVSPLSIAERVLDELATIEPEFKLFSLGGDHSVSYPLVKKYLERKKRSGKKVSIIHFDAHTDLLEERLGVPVCFGSWTFHILSSLEDPSQVIQLGIRSSGQNKDFWKKKYGVEQFWANEIINQSAVQMSAQIETILDKNQTEELYVTFDIDALDKEYASATGTPEKDGLFPHHAIDILNHLTKKYKITGADLVEVAPYISHLSEGSRNPEPENTLLSGNAISEFLLAAMNRS